RNRDSLKSHTRSSYWVTGRKMEPVATTSPGEPPATATSTSLLADLDTTALRLELLASLRKDIADIFKKELQETLGDTLLATLRGTVGEMEQALSGCTDDIAVMKKTIESLTANVTKLENKCEDLESRSRRNNIRIVGVPEGNDSCTTAAVAALLKEAFNLQKEPLLDRAHRTLQPKPKPHERPRAIVCRFHYYSDCVDILRRARELQQIKVRDLTISVFPDHTAKVARARAAFNEVRRQLRGIDGVRYGLIHPARLRITHDGVTKEFVSAEKGIPPQLYSCLHTSQIY
uniref:L1 transposable element RRM domain-containing protein n=1 Tax=Amphiprion ocellaris TaxID=80972 RepID=A0AAQ6ABC2_AMPOC